MKIILHAIVVACACACVATSHVSAEVIRDYFAEPELNPFKETLSQSLAKQIDPFNGILQLKCLDVKIPCNRGLFINDISHI